MTAGWFLARPDGSPIGPVRAEALLRRIRGGTLSPAELVWKEGMAGWVTIGDVPELACAIVREEEDPSTIREPVASMDFPDDGPETTPGTVPPALLEQARGPQDTNRGERAQAAADIFGSRPSYARVLPDPRLGADRAAPASELETVEVPLRAGLKASPLVTNTITRTDEVLEPRRLELVESRRLELIGPDSVPPTRDFGSTGIVIATTMAAAPNPSVSLPRQAGHDVVPRRTLRFSNTPTNPSRPMPRYDRAAYDELAAEQDEPAPHSGPPPPYPSHFSRPDTQVTSAAAPAPPSLTTTLVMPRGPAQPSPQRFATTLVLPAAAALQTADRLSQPHALRGSGSAATTAPRAPRTGGGILVLVLVVVMAFGIGLLGARYVVAHRRTDHRATTGHER